MTNDNITDGGSDSNQSNNPNGLSYVIDPDETPSEATVRAVAALTDTPVLDLDPLYNVIDPDNLDDTFERKNTSPDSPELTFWFNGCRVTVTPSKIHVQTTEKEPGESQSA